MKTLFVLLFLVLPFSSFAQESTQNEIVYVNGTGTANGFCDGSNYWCLQGIKDRAERDAENNARWQCQSKNGMISGFGSCFDSCNPPFLHPGDPSQFVSCRMDCSYRCEIRSNPTAAQ